MSTSYNLLFFPGFFASMASGFIIFWGCLYFLPTIIAMIRNKSNRGAIFLLNLFLGWTFVGWIVSLVWAVAAESQPQQVIINNTTPVSNSVPARESQQATFVRTTAPTLQKAASNATKPLSHQDKIDQLRQLKDLLDSGALTQEEFERQKAGILA
jgi:T4 superinfection immunity protein/putative oligomerization/nucleic acid binding protein